MHCASLVLPKAFYQDDPSPAAETATSPGSERGEKPIRRFTRLPALAEAVHVGTRPQDQSVPRDGWRRVEGSVKFAFGNDLELT